MIHVKDNEIRERNTEHSTVLVMGEQVRRELLIIAETLQNTPKPDSFNYFDEDALDAMPYWIKEDRDFTKKQWVKFSRMFKKFGLTDDFKELAKDLGWVYGKTLSRVEMHSIMQERRDKNTKSKIDKLRKASTELYVNSNMFDTFFK